MERFAPGFRECILARHSRNTVEMQAWDENLIGGDINGGAIDWKTIFPASDLASLCNTAEKGISLLVIDPAWSSGARYVRLLGSALGVRLAG